MNRIIPEYGRLRAEWGPLFMGANMTKASKHYVGRGGEGSAG